MNPTLEELRRIYEVPEEELFIKKLTSQLLCNVLNNKPRV